MAKDKNEKRAQSNRAKSMGLACPKGHLLPHYTSKGQCAVAWCALDPIEGTPISQHKPGRPPEGMMATALEDVPTVAADVPEFQKRKVGDALSTLTVYLKDRQKLTRQPTEEEKNDPESYADAQFRRLLPDAMAEVEFQLKYGNNAERREMAFAVLDGTGKRKKEALQGGGATIVLNVAAGSKLPWQTGAEVVEALSTETPKAMLTMQEESKDEGEVVGADDPGGEEVEAVSGDGQETEAAGDSP